jgi:hypothetical protein
MLEEDEWGESDQAMFEEDMEEMFDLLFEKQKKGEITLDQVEAFFPDEVKQRNS